MDILRAENARILTNTYVEVYIPMDYFDSDIAINRGPTIDSFGITFLRAFENGQPGDFKLLNLPIVTSFNVYESRTDDIVISGKAIPVLVLEYLKDAYMIHQTLPNGREVANIFLETMLNGKLPNVINYKDIMDIWWHNLEISGISYKVPSKIFEMIVATIYRNERNEKERYGQMYGKSANATGLEYKTVNVRNAVKNLSTFSGMVFEDMGMMISNGIDNSINDVEERESPLEKIIHY